MNYWLGIALGAYLIGAAIEGVSTASQLSHSVPELAKGFRERQPNCTQDKPSESAEPLRGNWQVFAAITSVSICGSFCWPCRLLHRSIKKQQNCQKD